MGRVYLEELVINGRVSLKLILYKYVTKMWIGFIWLRMGSQWQALVNTVMHKTGWKFLDYLSVTSPSQGLCCMKIVR
jgi:hypothetical protein